MTTLPPEEQGASDRAAARCTPAGEADFEQQREPAPQPGGGVTEAIYPSGVRRPNGRHFQDLPFDEFHAVIFQKKTRPGKTLILSDRNTGPVQKVQDLRIAVLLAQETASS